MDWITQIGGILDSIFTGPLVIVRAVLGFVLVFFLPGFAWTLLFFKAGQIGVLERVLLSFGLSIAIVVLSLFFLNLLFGFRITGMNSMLVITIITAIPVLLYGLKKLGTKQKEN